MPLLIPDISHYSQLGPSAFHDMKQAGYPAVIMKATEGGNYTDPKFADYFVRTRMADMIPGAYAFEDPSPSGIVQEQHFLDVAHLVKGDLQPIVDAEKLGLTRATFLQAMYTLEKKGYRPIQYSYLDFWKGLGAPTRWPLWLANYSGHLPALPTGTELFALQYTDKEKVAGVLNPCDCSKFFGTPQDLKKYLI